MVCILLPTRQTPTHGAQGGTVNPESSPPVRACKYITRNRVSLTSLKITRELGGRKTTEEKEHRAKTLQKRLAGSINQDYAHYTDVTILELLKCWPK